MGWWFGRKSAPADARPFVPAWLTSVGEEEGFARSVEGMNVYVKADDCWANYRLGAWEMGVVRGSSLVIDGEQVVGERLGAIASPTGGTIIDGEARETINEILSAMQQHGLIHD